jgi:hypothetical protein
MANSSDGEYGGGGGFDWANGNVPFRTMNNGTMALGWQVLIAPAGRAVRGDHSDTRVSAAAESRLRYVASMGRAAESRLRYVASMGRGNIQKGNHIERSIHTTHGR